MVQLNDFLSEWHNSLPYIEAHTSGSTGAPKAVRLPKADMVVSAKATNAFFGINSGSVLATPLGLDYIAGKMMAVRADLACCDLIIMPNRNSLEINRQIDLLAIVPSQVDSLVADCSPRLVGNVIVGGAPLSQRRREMLAEAGFKAFTTYGMTETCSHVALAEVGREENPFEAMPGVEFRTDSRGCLVIDAPAYTFGSIVTNDSVELIDSRRFRWLGRADNVINSGGIKIHPEQLENEISKLCADMPPFYIAGRPSDKWGSEAIMVVEGTQVDADRAFDAACRAISDHRRRPRAAVAVEKLPRTPGGNKVLRIVPPCAD